MTKPAQAVAIVAFVAGLVGCSREGTEDKGADLAACQIEADKAFPNHDEYYSDRVTKCMRVRGWHFTFMGDADLVACEIEADKAFPNRDIYYSSYYSDRVMKCMRVRGRLFDHPSPDLCTDQLGNSALEDWCYERTSPEKRITEIN